MNQEKEENTNSEIPKEFGNVVEALHDKHKLSSLRTYQGDVAEFIKEKNESTISIAMKEKEKKEKLEKYNNLYLNPKENTGQKSSGSNFTLIALSALLIGCGFLVYFYLFRFVKTEPVVPVVIEQKIVPYNSLINLSLVKSANFGSEISKLSSTALNGISIFKISDENGKTLNTSKEFLNFLGASLPGTLERNLKDDYVVGIFSQNGKASPFLVMTVSDFGIAFSGMLNWESGMEKDLAFFNDQKDVWTVSSVIVPVATTTATTTKVVSTSTVSLATSTIATSTNKIATTTVATTTASTTFSVKVPLKPDSFSWKDVIIKNKDTRGLVNQRDEAKIAYTFLDKNTILITNSLSAIGEISSIYASRSVAR